MNLTVCFVISLISLVAAAAAVAITCLRGRTGSVKIPIVYHSAEIEKIRQIKGNDWIDLRAAEKVVLKAGESAKISLGVSMKLPHGYEAHLQPRSSTFDNWGIVQTNSVGQIDKAYGGTNDIWKMPVLAVRDTVINVNDRICQFRVMRVQPKVVLCETNELDPHDRGGFGSTGSN